MCVVPSTMPPEASAMPQKKTQPPPITLALIVAKPYPFPGFGPCEVAWRVSLEDASALDPGNSNSNSDTVCQVWSLDCLRTRETRIPQIKEIITDGISKSYFLGSNQLLSISLLSCNPISSKQHSAGQSSNYLFCNTPCPSLSSTPRK